MGQGIRTRVLGGLLSLAGAAVLALTALRVLRPLEGGLGLALLGLFGWRRWEAGKAAQRIQAAERKFQILFNGTSDAVFLRPDSEFMGDATYMDVNDMACQRLGYSRTELLAMKPQDLDVQLTGQPVWETRRALREGGHVVVESELRGKTGAAFPVEIHLHLMESAGKPVILSISRDITRQRQSEAERKRSLARLQATLEAAADGLLAVDGQGHFTDYNQQFLEMWGLRESDLQRGDDDRALDLMLSQLKLPEAFLAKVDHLAAEPAASGFDVLEFWDGRVFERYSQPQWLDGCLVGRVWSFRDITARQKTEAFVRGLSQAVEQSPVSILITDPAGTIQFVNARVLATSGYSREQLLGQNPRIFNGGAMPTPVFEELWATISAGKVWEGDLQNRKQSGEVLWEHAAISPVFNSQGQITHYMGIKEDITAERQLQNQLRHAQKLEAVGQLAGGVAHDFNNILQVINGYGTLMHMTLPVDDPNRAGVAEILKAAERAAQLTQSLLAFSRKQVMNPKPVDLNTVVLNVDKFLRRVIGEDIQLQVTRHEGKLQVLVDIGQIEQVLMNLATNARDAMPAGGALAIATEWVETDEQFVQTHGFGKAGKYALLTVSDTGGGMDEATQKRIFDPFFTTKEMGRGTGLGLSIVYGIIKQHGGYILVQSGAGRGTRFAIYLPLVAADAGRREEPDQAPSPVKGSETVLVVEDEEGVRGMVEIVLRKYGYQVLLARDGQEAVEIFQAHRSSIQLILMDLIMPRKSGKQAYDEIRQLDPAIKVLFTSGYTADFIKSRGDLDQGMELVLKPVQPLDLLRKVRELLDRTEPVG